ncbi:hypothetical protein [Mycobacterium sp.]|uniref:hypothetical protein n=1 Tax=Mycobacterium sp. TaxID=1785 RepID=UPI003BAFAEBF
MRINVPPLDVKANLPQTVVDQLAPHHSWDDWWYSQGATAIGVVIAIAAAAVAWFAVQKQIKSDADQLADQIEAENTRQKRKDRLDALTDAAAVVTEGWYWAFKNLDPTPVTSEDVIRATADIQLKLVRVQARFDLLGMTKERDALKDYWENAEKANTVGKVTALGLRRKSLVDELTKPIMD